MENGLEPEAHAEGSADGIWSPRQMPRAAQLDTQPEAYAEGSGAEDGARDECRGQW